MSMRIGVIGSVTLFVFLAVAAVLLLLITEQPDVTSAIAGGALTCSIIALQDIAVEVTQRRRARSSRKVTST